MAIDFGLERVGVAVTDSYRITITPLDTLLYKKADFWTSMINIVKQYSVDVIVIGIPVNETINANTTNTLMKEHNKFVQVLKEKLTQIEWPVRIDFIDESYTSKEAVELMITLGKSRSSRAKKGNIDAYAASLILRDYIETTY